MLATTQIGLLQQLLSRKLVMISGKGGTGKSLVTAALGKLAADHGRTVLLAESSTREQLPPLFGENAVGHRESLVAENVHCINLSARECLREYVVKRLGMARLYDRVFNRKVVKSFLDAVPGLAETMVLGRLYYTCCEKDSYDLVIFDAPASGHFLSLLTTPQTIVRSGLIGPLVGEVQKVLDFLSDPLACGIVIVTIPEELIVNETLEFIPTIMRECPAKLNGLLVNRAVLDGPLRLRQLAGAGASDPRLSEPAEYVSRKTRTLVANQEFLLKEIETLGVDLPYLVLPDLGFVDEPLHADVVRSFFGENPLGKFNHSTTP